MVRLLILGVNGQDGSYLAEQLLGWGHDVTSVGRQALSRWVDPSRFRYVPLDIMNYAALDQLLDALRPEQIYHLAASHGPAGHPYEAVWREALACQASVGFFFNRDSPRRPDTYFLPRLAAKLAAKRRGTDGPALAMLDFWCDWGDAKKFMGLVADLMQAQPDDLVFATGKPLFAATLADRLSRAMGIGGGSIAPAGQQPFRADISRMRSVLGRSPRSDGLEVASWILRDRYGIEISPRGDVAS